MEPDNSRVHEEAVVLALKYPGDLTIDQISSTYSYLKNGDRFSRKLKDGDLAVSPRGLCRNADGFMNRQEANDKDIRNLDAFISSLTDEEIDELNADEGDDEVPMPFETFCRKENIKIRK